MKGYVNKRPCSKRLIKKYVMKDLYINIAFDFC